MKRAGTVVACIAFALLLGPRPAAAQGNGHGNAFGHYKSTVSAASTPPPGSAGPSIAGTGVRNFGSWLDDASVMEVGTGFVSVGFGIWKTPVYREVDLPTIDSAVAVHRRVQIGMSVPYYRATVGGAALNGTISHSYSIHHDDLSAALGLRKGRTDANGGVTYAIRPDIAIYSSVGRTISARDDNSATFVFNAGVSLAFK